MIQEVNKLYFHPSKIRPNPFQHYGVLYVGNNSQQGGRKAPNLRRPNFSRKTFLQKKTKLAMIGWFLFLCSHCHVCPQSAQQEQKARHGQCHKSKSPRKTRRQEAIRQIKGRQAPNRDAAAQTLPPPGHHHPHAEAEREEHKQKQLPRGEMRQVQSLSEGEHEQDSHRDDTQYPCRPPQGCIHTRHSINSRTNAVIDFLSPAIGSFDVFQTFRLLL